MSLPYYKAYPRDFFEGTLGMDFEVKAAYRLLLDMIYMHGGRLTDDPRFIAGLLGCSVRKWTSLRAAIVATGKIVVIGGYLGNNRADKELDSLKSFQGKQRENASAPRKNNNITEAMAKPKDSHTEPEPDTEPKEEPDGSSKKRASRLPENWSLPDDWRQESIEAGCPANIVDREAERFRNYWIAKAGKDAAKLDWRATWRNWIGKRIDELPKPVSGPRGEPFRYVQGGIVR
jgi:uncharacterized protein YdaU (DUF1376 family)